MLTIFLWSNAWFSCIDGVAGIMPIITCPSCNLTNTRFCHEKGFVENTRFCRKTGFVANTRLFGFVWCRLLRRHLGFDSDFAQMSSPRNGGWNLWCNGYKLVFLLNLNLISKRFKLVFHWNSTGFQIYFHCYLNKVSTGFLMDFYLYSIEILTGFPIGFHWNLIEIYN